MENIKGISSWDLALAALLLLIPALLSIRRGLGLHKNLLIGGLRCFGQLMAVGFLLEYIFALDRWSVVVAVLLIMVLAGARIATQRQSQPVAGIFKLTAFSIGISSFIALSFITLVIIGVQPWYDPRYLLPLAGMVIGNAMNGSALAAERLGSEMRLRKPEIEVYLALGATPAQASHEAVRNTIRASLIPTINSLMSVGIVHLPGIMTGQILSNTSPTTAIRYQIVIMYMVVFVVMATAMLVTSLSYRKYFTGRMQLEGRYFFTPG